MQIEIESHETQGELEFFATATFDKEYVGFGLSVSDALVSLAEELEQEGL